MTLLAELSKAIWQRAAGPGGNTEEACPSASVEIYRNV